MHQLPADLLQQTSQLLLPYVSDKDEREALLTDAFITTDRITI